MSAVIDKSPCSKVSKALRCNAIARDRVDNTNSIPIACINTSRASPIACRNITPGTTKDPVIPVSTPFARPAKGPTHNACRGEMVRRSPNSEPYM